MLLAHTSSPVQYFIFLLILTVKTVLSQYLETKVFCENSTGKTTHEHGEIRGCHGGHYEDYHLLKYDDVQFGRWIPIFQRTMLPPSASFFYSEDGEQVYSQHSYLHAKLDTITSQKTVNFTTALCQGIDIGKGMKVPLTHAGFS